MTEQVPFSPSEPFRYCPADGKRLSDLRPSGGATCPLCGRSWYRNSAPAVGNVIVEDGKALLTLRAREPEKGRLDLPGAFLGVGDHPVDGLAREAREELRVEIEVLESPILLATHTYGLAGQYVLAIGFRARIVAGEPEPTDDVAAIRWVSAEEVDPADFDWKHDRRRWPERRSAARSLPVLVAGMSPTRGRRSQRAPLARGFGFCQ
jgi:ADP-ribose pyrophosphatase YjhB (NUDIX family)